MELKYEKGIKHFNGGGCLDDGFDCLNFFSSAIYIHLNILTFKICYLQLDFVKTINNFSHILVLPSKQLGIKTKSRNIFKKR